MRLRSALLGAVLALTSWAASAQVPFFFASQGASRYVVLANDYDGTNDYLTRAADLAADSDKGTFSVWIRLDGGDAAQMRLLATGASGTTNGLTISRNASNKLRVFGTSTLDVNTLQITSTTAYTASATWHHLLAAWDKAAGTSQMYVDGADDMAAGGTNLVGNLDYSEGNFSVGAMTDGAEKVNGCVVEEYFANTYLDISNSANRAKFRDSNGRPVDLGTNCTLPTGSQPALCLKGQSTTNLGAAGGMTVTGALDTCSSSPTD